MGARDTFLENHSALEPLLGRAAWVNPLRSRALERFAASGLPTTRDEAWRFTSLQPFAETCYQRPGPAAPVPAALAALVDDGTADLTLVFVDGRPCPELTRGRCPPGLSVLPLASALDSHAELLEPLLTREPGPETHAFDWLNQAFLRDGALIVLGDRAEVTAPLRLVHLSTADGTPVASHVRHVVVAGRESRATVLESHLSLGGGPSFSSTSTLVSLAAGARLDHLRLQEEGSQALHVSALDVLQQRDSRFAAFSLALGGALGRSDVRVVMDAPGCDCSLNGLYLAAGRQVLDSHTWIDHAGSHCSSTEHYRGVLDDVAHAVFAGRIVVRPEAQKTDAHQSNHNLLLSEEALVNAMPQLEIYADDVKCTHGATVGQLDEEALFYLRSRGLPARAARTMLTWAFASQPLERVSDAGLRGRVESSVRRWLEARANGGVA